MKKALIFGIAGQDGSYLTELLLEKGYKVYGFDKSPEKEHLARISHLLDRIKLINGDIMDQTAINKAIRVIQPDEVYNFASPSFVPDSWEYPIMTADVAALGVTRILEAMRLYKPDARFYQASSSEMFGNVEEYPQSEKTPFSPRNPYGVSKVYGYWIAVNYRQRYRIFACSGICFNHESPRRGMEFVTRKVGYEVAKISLGLSSSLKIGNLDSKRDWGFAGDYVRAMWLMLQQDYPDDYVIATGELHSVEELLENAFACVGLKAKDYVVVTPELCRADDSVILVGDATKARKKLGWRPRASFNQLVEMMVNADLKRIKEKVPSQKMLE